jgi:hypothetical protein
VADALAVLLPDRAFTVTGMPPAGRAALTRQTAEGRLVLHLLYATPAKRGAAQSQWGTGTQSVEVIEGLVPLHGVHCAVRLPEGGAPPRRVTLEPQGEALPFACEGSTGALYRAGGFLPPDGRRGNRRRGRGRKTMSVLDRPATDGARAPRRFIGEEERRQYQADGFLVLRGLLSEDERQAIVDWLRGVAARRDELPSWHIIPEPGAPADPQDPLTAVRKFQALPDYPEAMRYFGSGTPPAEATRELLGGPDDLRLMFLSCFAKPAGHGTETPWHQDQGLWSIWNPAATSCWVAIDECTPENGCLRFLRGSHRGAWSNTSCRRVPSTRTSPPKGSTRTGS